MALELTTTALMQDEISDSSVSATTLATYGNAAEAAIARYCNRYDEASGSLAHWLTGARTQYVEVRYDQALVLRWTPVTAITSISTVEGASSTTAITLSELTADGIPITGTFVASKGIIRFRQNPRSLWLAGYDWPRGPAQQSKWPNFGQGLIKAVYTGGYAASSAIPDLILAATRLAGLMYRLKNVNLSLQSESLGDYGYTRANGEADPLASIRAILQPHIRMGVS